MTMVARAIQEDLRKQRPSLKALSWEEHLRYGLCQETLSRQKPHRKVVHPWAATLSLDAAGLFRKGRDVSTANGYSRYLLVGAYTWLVPRGDCKQKEDELGPVSEDAPEIDPEGSKVHDAEDICDGKDGVEDDGGSADEQKERDPQDGEEFEVEKVQSEADEVGE